jgi:hypothetical protein
MVMPFFPYQRMARLLYYLVILRWRCYIIANGDPFEVFIEYIQGLPVEDQRLVKDVMQKFALAVVNTG